MIVFRTPITIPVPIRMSKMAWWDTRVWWTESSIFGCARLARWIPGGGFTSPASSFYTGGHAPSLVEVEIALVDEKLVAEMEAGIEQRMEGEAASLKLNKKLNYIKDNLDRVYFFKQLINIQGRGQ